MTFVYIMRVNIVLLLALWLAAAPLLAQMPSEPCHAAQKTVAAHQEHTALYDGGQDAGVEKVKAGGLHAMAMLAGRAPLKKAPLKKQSHCIASQCAGISGLSALPFPAAGYSFIYSTGALSLGAGIAPASLVQYVQPHPPKST